MTFTTLGQIDAEISRLQTLRSNMLSKVPFKTQFNGAFAILNRIGGNHNFVHLTDLRNMLSNFTKDQFNAELRLLRLARIYTLSGTEGRHGISKEQRDAAIYEDGDMLSYCSLVNS